MFTGIIKDLGRVEDVNPGEESTRLVIATALCDGTVERGESIAVDGVCLTVVTHEAGRFEADVIPETLAKTTLGELRVGSRANLERAMRLSDRLGGHLVQGHVDTTAEVEGVDRTGGEYRLRVRTPAEIRRFIAYKGSVALQGVSLTVAAVTGDCFEVALIPETLGRTNLGTLDTGSRVNVEVDLLARYLEALERERSLDVTERGGND